MNRNIYYIHKMRKRSIEKIYKRVPTPRNMDIFYERAVCKRGTKTEKGLLEEVEK